MQIDDKLTLATIKDDLPSLKDRTTDELVIALVGPVGAGVSTSAKALGSLFAKRFKYDVVDIHVSTIITESSKYIDVALPASASADDRTTILQEMGTKLRKRFGDAYLSDKCIAKIVTERTEKGTSGGDRPLAQPRRRVHIIDSLKNPAELQRLAEVYGDTFWCFGIFAPEEVRKQRLIDLKHTDVTASAIMARDQKEGVNHGQRVGDTIQYADFFIRNDGDSLDKLSDALQRCLDIIFGIGIHTPTQDENAMYEAASAASKSACMSRQVGAVIYSVDGELIGVGDNDVPKKGGGLYYEHDPAGDNRCFRWGSKICHNDSRKDALYHAIYEQLRESGLLVDTATKIDVVTAVLRTDAKNLIEYSRAVHAEMEAIVSVARGHKAGIVGGTMYTTTYPCHSCARHIVASGIVRVVYIEPYEKSLAMKLHRDAISDKESEHASKVVFLQYNGVAPKNILRLFKPNSLQRKDAGAVIERDPASASPLLPSPLDGFFHREQLVAAKVQAEEELSRAENKARADEGGKDVR